MLRATVSLGGGHLGQPAGLHATFLGQPGHMVPVALGPTAPGTARGEALQPGLTVKRSGLAVDPTPTDGLVQGMGMGDGPSATAFLVDLVPDLRRAVVMLSTPGSP